MIPMNRFFTLLTLLCSMILHGQSQELEQIYSITEIQKDYAYYNEQAGLWEKELKESPKDAMAWLNYYTAARMNNLFAGEKGSRYDLVVIAEEVKKNIPNTFEYYYVCYKQEYDREAAYPDLLKAYTVDPGRYETWEGFIAKAAFEGDDKTMKTFLEKWSKDKMYSPGLSNWNYNTIIGLQPNAILITFADNDTYPLWFLQRIKGLRKDVQIINASMIFDDTYRENTFKIAGITPFQKDLQEMKDYEKYREEMVEHILKETDRPVYIGISGPQSFREKHRDHLYIVGLAFQYSKEDFDHVAVIRNNYENLFLKDYLKYELNNDFSQSVVDYMNQQYIPCLTVLYKHYVLSGEKAKAMELEQLLLRVGERGQRKKEIEDFLANHRN